VPGLIVPDDRLAPRRWDHGEDRAEALFDPRPAPERARQPAGELWRATAEQAANQTEHAGPRERRGICAGPGGEIAAGLTGAVPPPFRHVFAQQRDAAGAEALAARFGAGDAADVKDAEPLPETAER
jgi:hypothetical protein